MSKGQYTEENNPKISSSRKEYYTANREKILARMKEYRQRPHVKERVFANNKKARENRTTEQRQALREYMRKYSQDRRDQTIQKYRSRTPEEKFQHQLTKRKSRLRKFGMTIEEADRIFENQGKACAICRSDNPGTRHNWSFDHDHVSGKFRAILCHGCNTGLGSFRENQQFLLAAIKYLAIAENGSE